MLQRVHTHRGVAALLDHFECAEAFYLVMEFVPGGELFDELIKQGNFSEAIAAKYIYQLADATAFLHAQGLCHADIKPENLLLTSKGADADVKLVDFGLADDVRSPSDTKPGTWAYWPPEAFRGGRIGKATDMWSIGCVLFVMLSGYHPFDPSGETDDDTLQKRICDGEPDFDDPCWASVSSDAKRVLAGLLRHDLSQRLTVEQLLQDPWLRRASPAPLANSDLRLSRFRQSTATLRAAAFATILQQQGAQHRGSPGAAPAPERGGTRSPTETVSRRPSANHPLMLEAEMLNAAFRVFDPEAKGYITETDLARVLSSLGHSETSAQELHATLSEAAKADREGKRVLYGDFVELMTCTDRQRFKKGDVIFREGEKADGFLLLLSGSCAVYQKAARQGPVGTLHPGDYFGETALLSKAPRNATVTCLQDVEVLRLSREDFEAGFLQSARGTPPVAEARQTLGFIQMVSRMQRSTLQDGQPAFREGEKGDRFFIVEGGEVIVESQGRELNRLGPGDCFGELALLTGAPRNATVRCSNSSGCKLLSMGVEDFSKLMKRSAAVEKDIRRLGSKRTHGAAS